MEPDESSHLNKINEKVPHDYNDDIHILILNETSVVVDYKSSND